MHLEGEARLNKEEVEQPHAQECRKNSRSQSENHGDQQHREQEQHHDICQVEIDKQRCRQHRYRGAQRDRQRVLLPKGERRQSMGATGHTGEHDFHTDKIA